VDYCVVEKARSQAVVEDEKDRVISLVLEI
jgi:hypothetical protein